MNKTRVSFSMAASAALLAVAGPATAQVPTYRDVTGHGLGERIHVNGFSSP